MDSEHKLTIDELPCQVHKDIDLIPFEWEELYNNSSNQTSYFEATYRAKVIGGWLIRHETCCDYQNSCDDNMLECEDTKDLHHKHIDFEGWQNVKNTISFISDKYHEWKIK